MDVALLANTKRELKQALNVTETVFNNCDVLRRKGPEQQNSDSTAGANEASARTQTSFKCLLSTLITRKLK